MGLTDPNTLGYWCVLAACLIWVCLGAWSYIELRRERRRTKDARIAGIAAAIREQEARRALKRAEAVAAIAEGANDVLAEDLQQANRTMVELEDALTKLADKKAGPRAVEQAVERAGRKAKN
jgi:hypothetical protein